MANNNLLEKAQKGKAIAKPLIPAPTQVSAPNPMVDEAYMQERYGNHSGSRQVTDLPSINYRSPNTSIDISDGGGSSALQDLLKFASGKDESGGGITRTLDEYAQNESGRYDFFMPGSFDNEDAAGQQQGFGSKMVNGIGKGLLLTGTTFLQGTVGLVNGTFQAINDGKFSSFYDNEFNRSLDEANKWSEDAMPNYYTAQESNANWYSPKYWATGNFLWDGVVKNMGFAAGAYFTGGVYTSALKALPYASRLFSVGKAAETLAATEAGLAGTNNVANAYGKIRKLSDTFLKDYKSLNLGGRVLVAGLSTTGEAGIEALHSSNEFRQKLIDKHIEQFGVTPVGDDLEAIDIATEGAGNATFFTNVALLTATNYIQFPKILGSSYKAEKGIINGLVREIDDIAYNAGKFTSVVSKYPKLSKLNKIRPYTFSISEAFEEVSQYSATVGTQDYYNKKYNGEATSWMESIGVGITTGAFSDEGAKNALIGGLSGALMLGRGKYKQSKAKTANTAKAIELLNKTSLSDFTKETINSVNRGTVLQQDREAALKIGDILNSKNIEADYIINYLTPRIKYGRFDLVKADITEYRNLAATEEGFAQLQSEGKALESDTKEAYIARLDRFEETANNTNSLWQSLNLRYSGQLGEDGKPTYTSDVMNKMLYAAAKVADFDVRIPELSGPLASAGIDTIGIVQSLIDGNVEAFNEAIVSIKGMDILADEKEILATQLEDLSEIALERKDFIKAYEDIKNNPKEYAEAPLSGTTGEAATHSSETIKVKTKQGEIEVELGTEYFVGKGVDYSKDPLDTPVTISQFVVEGVNEDGTLKIKTQDGNIKDVSPDVLENFKIGKVSTLENNKTANFFYNNRNDIFEFNFGKNFGGRRRGRLEYQDGKLYFVYLTPKGKVAKKELNNSHFIPQKDFKMPRVSKVGNVNSPQQQEAREQFLSPAEVAAQKATLAKNRDARLEVLSQLGQEATESLEEINKNLEKQTSELNKVKEDLENIEKMKVAGLNGPKIKLNFSKATKVFTQALNKLTKLQNIIEADIADLNNQKEELELNIAYFQDFTNEISDLPEDSDEFLQELKDQVSLLVDNGKNLNNALSAANKLAKGVDKAIKDVTKLFRKTLKGAYIVDQDYSQYLSELLDLVAAGENLAVNWPLLKIEMANFALTSDLSKDATVNDNSLINAIDSVKKLTKDLADMRAEYKARKIITDRFQKIMNEYKAQVSQEEKLTNNNKLVNQLLSTADNGPVIDSSNSVAFEAESKKSNEIIPRATVPVDEDKAHQVRANLFGLNLNSFSNRDSIRGIFVTANTQDQLLPGVIERMLDNNAELIEKFKDGMIIMVMIDESGALVGVDGKPIPKESILLDNAIYQTMPSQSLTSGGMFRESTTQEVKDSVIEQYKAWQKETLSQTTLGIPQEIDASFGSTESNQNNTTSAQDAGLITEDDLEIQDLIYIPTTNKAASKGTVAFNSPFGSVFLELPNGYVKLKNRIHTKAEATAIYDSVLQLAKNMLDVSSGGINSDSSVRILSFLRGVVYWGIPKDQQGNRKETGNNSVFFEKDKATGSLMLVLSKDGTTFKFTPSQLEKNKVLIINKLEQMYNNATGSKSKDINKKFEQIISISIDGEFKSVTWLNYQSYLLSNKNPDGSQREGYQVPLSTTINPEEEGKVNRKGIYFYTTNTADDFIIPEPKAVVKPIVPKVLLPKGAPTVASTDTEFEFTVGGAPTGKWKLDGVSVNTYVSPDGKQIMFTASADTNMDNYTETISILKGGDLDAVIKTITDAGKDFKQILKQTVYNAIASELTVDASQAAYIEAITPAPEVIAQDSEFEFTVVEQSAQDQIDALEDQINNMMSDINSEDLRIAIESEADRIKPENWNKVEAFLKKNFPNLPVYRVKNIIQATNGRQAWGMFKDGAIYVYENAETGTAYHEVFEAVWKMFTDVKEQGSVINEFKSRQGTFVDRPTGKTIKYSDATAAEIKEELAEEFRDYIQDKKIPGKSKGGSFISRLFADLKNFISKFLLGKDAQSKTEELFSKIGNGYYKKHMPYATKLSMAKEGIISIDDAFATSESEFRLKTLSDRQSADVNDEMTFLLINSLIKTDRSLFNIPSLSSTEVYDNLKVGVLTTIRKKEIAINKLLKNGTDLPVGTLLSMVEQNQQLERDVVSDWTRLVERHKEYIRSFEITFDEADNVQLGEENKIKESNKFDATKIDSFKKSNVAIRLLLASNPTYSENGKPVLSSINGRKLMPVSKTFITLMNRLHKSTSIEDMMSKLGSMAMEDPAYKTLYKRITKTDATPGAVDLSKIDTTYGASLLSGMWKTFKKQNPDVKNVFIFDNGEVAVGDAALSSAANQLRSEYINSIATLAKAGKGFFTYDVKQNAYFVSKKKLGAAPTNTYTEMVSFLAQMGIPFTVAEVKRLKGSNQRVFFNAVNGIKRSLAISGKITSLSKKTLDINKRLLELGILKTAIANPEFSSTYFNVSGERTQSFIGTNAASDLHNALSSIQNLSELAGTQYEYILTDSFSKGSNIINRMFTSSGQRKPDIDLFNVAYAGGTINEAKGQQKSSANLTFTQRLAQELNMNLSGQYLNLIPGDASIEWMLNMGNPIHANDFSRGFTDVHDIFKGYFLSEFELSKEDRSIANVKNRETKDLRFFKGILGDSLHADVITTEGTAEEVYIMFETKIKEATEQFIKKDVGRYIKYLQAYGVLSNIDGTYTFKNVDLAADMDANQMIRQLTAINVNYMIANIEMHKLLYSDPYQYKDELKRTKSFNSPRQAIVSNSPKMNVAFNNVWNEGFKKGDVGYTNFTQDYFRTTTHKDVIGIVDLPGYGSYEETDGGGIISQKSYREFRIRASDWNENEELQYRYDVAFEKRDKKIKLSKSEIEILKNKNPAIKSAYTSLKPIVSGSKLGKDGNSSKFNNVVLDKYALYPLSYRILKELNADSNALKLYNKMQNEDVDYIVFDSGRKVGAETSHDTYNKDGSFNDGEYIDIVNIPFSIMSLQSEVPSKGSALVTRGSQVTKLITMDYMDNGVPSDFFSGKEISARYKAWHKLTEKDKKQRSPLYKEIVHNQELLVELTNEGFSTMLVRLGIIEKDGEYIVEDFSEATKTLRDELFKREINDNISDALTGFLDGKSVLEATPAYQQIKNILYSIVDKQIVSPKISGGLKVQIPSALLESTRTEETTINGKKGYTSDVLKFYEDKDGERVMEIMVGRWFKSPKSDAELLEYFNNTKEGQKILSGLAFRIPTQKQNSIDAIRIKQFLPEEFGDNVVVPAGIVAKVGSDFDIDKLSIYLKNVFMNKGDLKLVPFFGFGQQAKDKFAAIFDQGGLFTKEQKRQLDSLGALKAFEVEGLFDTEEGETFKDLLGQMGIVDQEDTLVTFVNEMSEIGVKDAVVNRLYKQSLENEFIQSSENLVTHPSNFQRLITPNSAEQLKALGKFIAEKTTGGTFDYTDVSNMLDRRFMARLRHSFVIGKQAIGIAAVNQTNHSLNQRSAVYVDKDRMSNVSIEDAAWLTVGNGDVNFEKFNTINIDGRNLPSLSGVTNSDGQLISDILGQFIDGYVDISKGPWIMELGAKPNVAATFMFLTKIGVPIDTVSYFMNQPIIREYLQAIENKGYSYLFIQDIVNETLEEYDNRDTSVIERIPTKTLLRGNVGKESFTAKEKNEQQFMLLEFLKYAKMASQLFEVTQGTNFDTSNFNDPYLIFKKGVQLERAKNTIISSVDEILENSFIGNLAGKLNQSRDAMANFLVSDRGTVREIIQKVLLPYTGGNINNKKFVGIARKVVNDLFDYVVQTDQNFNLALQKMLLSDKGVASQLVTFLNQVKKNPRHPLFHNHVINLLEVRAPIRGGDSLPTNITLKNTDNKVYDQNSIIYGFRELKEALEGQSDLYDNIVTLSILQSGLGNSPISFTSLLPYEDFEKIYNKSLSKIENIPNLNEFYTIGVFERNNWSKSDIVPSTSLFSKFDDRKQKFVYPSIEYLPSNVKAAITKGTVPQIATQSVSSGQVNDDYKVMSWSKDISKSAKAEMRKAGDYSYINKGLFKKVYQLDGTPLIHSYEDTKGLLREYFVYKMINAWGDSFRAQEFYTEAKESVIDNGFIKVPNEVSDATVVSLYSKEKQKKVTKSNSITVDQANSINNLKDIEPAYNQFSNFDIQYAINRLIPNSENKNVLFHGTGFENKITSFKKNKIGIFASDFTTAGEYANWDSTNRVKDNNDSLSKPQVIPVIFNLQNSVKLDSKPYEDIANVSSSNSIISTNTIDPINGGTQYIVKDPSQIIILNSATTISKIADIINKKNKVSLPAYKTISLRDKKTYNAEDVNAKMLEAMGYSPEHAGALLKKLC